MLKLFCSAIFLALAAMLACSSAEDESFKIGVMESVTGPGETYGNVAVRAKQMAVDEINAAGGVNGRMIELIVEDSKCSAQDSITAYRKLTDVDEVKIILGTSCSGAMLGAAPLAEADGVVLFSGLATNPDIANAGDYIFRTAMSDLQLGIDTGNVLWADGIRSLATITEATDYAEGVRRTTVDQFTKRGGELAAEERYSSDVTDFRSQLTKLFEEDPGALHIAAQSESSGGTIIKQARELGLRRPHILGSRAGRRYGPGYCRRRRHRVEGRHRRLGPGQPQGSAGPFRLQVPVRLHHAPLVSGFGLRRCLHRR